MNSPEGLSRPDNLSAEAPENNSLAPKEDGGEKESLPKSETSNPVEDRQSLVQQIIKEIDPNPSKPEPNQLRILRALSKPKNELSGTNLSRTLDIGYEHVMSFLRSLLKLGLIENSGEDPKSNKARLYKITPLGLDVVREALLPRGKYHPPKTPSLP